MNHYCNTCNRWQPLDESWEIGVCTDQPELPLVTRFRFKREEWTCWHADMGTKYIYPLNVKVLELVEDEPTLEPELTPEPVKLPDPAIVTATCRREMNGQVTRAYWYVKKLEKLEQKARIA